MDNFICRAVLMVIQNQVNCKECSFVCHLAFHPIQTFSFFWLSLSNWWSWEYTNLLLQDLSIDSYHLTFLYCHHIWLNGNPQYTGVIRVSLLLVFSKCFDKDPVVTEGLQIPYHFHRLIKSEKAFLTLWCHRMTVSNFS